MKAARLYDTPEQFAQMMKRQVEESLGLPVSLTEEEPLLLLVDNGGGQMKISLHNTYSTYMAGGDLNAAVEYLNDIVRNSLLLRSKQDEVCKLDPRYLYPAIREEGYAEASLREVGGISDPCLPGLCVMYLEIKDGLTKVVSDSMLALNPGLDAAKVRERAFRNLRTAGWQKPWMVLPSKLAGCTFEVYMFDTLPGEYQFLDPSMNGEYGRRPYLIAFTNRTTAIVMRSRTELATYQQVQRLAEQSGFRVLVRHSVAAMPRPVSDRIFWVRGGKAVLLTPDR